VEDVAIRNRLYTRVGAGRARMILAMTFPGGSARTEIKRRVMMRSEKGGSEGKSALISAVVEEIVAELAEAVQKKSANDEIRAAS